MRRKFRCDSNCWNIMKCRRTNCKTGMDYLHNSIINHKFWLCADQLIIIWNFTHFTLRCLLGTKNFNFIVVYSDTLYSGWKNFFYYFAYSHTSYSEKKVIFCYIAYSHTSYSEYTTVSYFLVYSDTPYSVKTVLFGRCLYSHTFYSRFKQPRKQSFYSVIPYSGWALT